MQGILQGFSYHVVSDLWKEMYAKANSLDYQELIDSLEQLF
jgi:hypothetical protein